MDTDGFVGRALQPTGLVSQMRKPGFMKVKGFASITEPVTGKASAPLCQASSS